MLIKKKLSTTRHNFLEMNETLMITTLNELTLKQLKKLCKDQNLHKYSKLNKKNVLSLLTGHFLTLRASLLEKNNREVVAINSKIPMILNEKGHINVSIWFRAANLRLSRWLESKAFNEILDEHCKIGKVTKDGNDDTYLDSLLALVTAAQFNSELRYDIFKFYTYRLDELEQKNAAIVALTHQLSLLEQGISIEVTKRWETFDFQFAYYILSIDNVIKCGAVGSNNSESSDNLDARFYSHRNTHARFYLVNVFQFHDSKSVTSFENFIKMVLLEYSLGKGNGSLEQYECKDQDTVAFINRTVIKIFETLKEKNPGIGSMCPKEKIEKYNLSVRERTNN